ncbi:MAG: TetR/AcrR family transcriptional regulator [Candidatus Krumholzibacteriota bacterium]|nr:TetR/AcrR family transcriptional regulator [Candidatus Krumholzibacteriota bacterium]
MADNTNNDSQLSRRERERKRHREEILIAASDIFGRHGFEKTSMQMIADRADLSIGKIYSHFEGKEAIYREVIDYIVDLMRERCDTAIKPGCPAVEAIRIRLRTAMEIFEDHIPFIRLFHEVGGIRVDAVAEKAEKGHVEKIAAMLREAIDKGEFSADIDPEIHAVMIEGAGHRLLEVLADRDADSFGQIAELLDRIFLQPFETGKSKNNSPKEL